MLQPVAGRTAAGSLTPGRSLRGQPRALICKSFGVRLDSILSVVSTNSEESGGLGFLHGSLGKPSCSHGLAGDSLPPKFATSFFITYIFTHVVFCVMVRLDWTSIRLSFAFGGRFGSDLTGGFCCRGWLWGLFVVWRLSVVLGRATRAQRGTFGRACVRGWETLLESSVAGCSIGWPSCSGWPTNGTQSKRLQNRSLSDWLARLPNGAQRAFHFCDRLMTKD